MKHIANPAVEQLHAEDFNNPEHASSAVTLDWPETFSDPAQDVIRYFDGTMFLFLYDSRYVVTDESLALSESSEPGAPACTPRYVGDSLDAVEGWLEKMAGIANDDPDAFPGWQDMLDRQAT